MIEDVRLYEEESQKLEAAMKELEPLMKEAEELLRKHGSAAGEDKGKQPASA